jgi:hypothetical protein
MAYREIRVRPVVRYIVTDYSCDDDANTQSSVALGIFDNASLANRVGEAVASSTQSPEYGGTPVIFEPARQLKIDWLRASGDPKEAIRWELSEVEYPPARSIFATD